MTSRVLFIDRDGTLIEEPDDFQVDSVSKVSLVEGVIPALLELSRHGYRFVMVSNQDGLGTEAFPQAEFDAAHEFVLALFGSQGIRFDEVFICPHLPEHNCGCRKPRSGLLTRYLATTAIDVDRSAVIGDRETDLELAANLGVRGIRINSGHADDISWADIARLMCHSDRVATYTRSTNETEIQVSVNLDAADDSRIETGIGFFDHMLEQVAKHGGFSLQLECQGDLHVDEHHTVEDVAICIGSALRDALGNKYGIGRYGFVLPMDESRCEVALDLSGRAAFDFDGRFERDSVGELSTEMVQHFFRSLAETMAAALHIRVRGENTHHMIEACFKCVGRALRQAFARTNDQIPSTKGTLSA